MHVKDPGLRGTAPRCVVDPRVRQCPPPPGRVTESWQACGVAFPEQRTARWALVPSETCRRWGDERPLRLGQVWFLATVQFPSQEALRPSPPAREAQAACILMIKHSWFGRFGRKCFPGRPEPPNAFPSYGNRDNTAMNDHCPSARSASRHGSPCNVPSEGEQTVYVNPAGSSAQDSAGPTLLALGRRVSFSLRLIWNKKAAHRGWFCLGSAPRQSHRSSGNALHLLGADGLGGPCRAPSLHHTHLSVRQHETSTPRPCDVLRLRRS